MNECRYGSSFWEDDDGNEMELLVTYHYHAWSEARPYGSTVAYERQVEVEELSYMINQPGGSVLESVRWSELLLRFDEEFIQGKINQAMED